MFLVRTHAFASKEFGLTDVLERILCALHVYDCAEEKGHEGEASGEKESSCDSLKERLSLGQ